MRLEDIFVGELHHFLLGDKDDFFLFIDARLGFDNKVLCRKDSQTWLT